MLKKFWEDETCAVDYSLAPYIVLAGFVCLLYVGHMFLGG
jgi:hypothetical protein